MTSFYLNVQRLTPGALIPRYHTEGSSGADLSADEDVSIYPGEWRAVSTGLAMTVGPGYEIQIRPRSGLAAKFGVTVLNAPGTIDSDYRGEVKVILINHGNSSFTVRRGDRIAQLVIAPVSIPDYVCEVTELDETLRGTGGLGSTGKD